MSSDIKRKIAVLKCGPTGCVSCNILFQRKITLNYMWQEHPSLLCSTKQTLFLVNL